MSFLFVLAFVAVDPGVFPPSDVKAGQKAYGLTVFQGDKVEKFDLVLLGVLRNFLGPQSDLVLARLTDPKLELAGVVAGMSGSPVYVDGKLLGALGYSMGAFMKEGICGITPIENMRQVRDLPTTDLFAPVAHTSDATVAPGLAFADAAAEMRPIAAPLSVAGVDPRVLKHFAPTFDKLGFLIAPGGMSAAAAGAAGGARGVTKLEAGSSVAAQLVRGDLSIAATGTVTSVDGKKVLAFGHPYMGAGATSIPMVGSRIITIVPSMNRSFKMGEVLDEIGSFTQDRLSAIAGEIGSVNSMIPVSVEIATAPEGRTSKFKFEIARNPQTTPELVNMVLANAFIRRNDAGLVGTVEVEGVMQLEGGRTHKLRSLIAMERDVMLPIYAAMSVARPFDILWRNEFGPPMVKGIDVKARISYDVRRLSIVYANVRHSPYKAGDTVSIEVGLKPDDKPVKPTTFELQLPPSFEPGEYELVIGGAGELNAIESRSTGLMHPQSREALLEALGQLRSDGPLYVALLGKGKSVRVGEALLNDVPLSWATQVVGRDADTRASQAAQSLLLEQQKPMGAFVTGEAHVPLRVRSVR